jgi:hypothetical protein
MFGLILGSLLGLSLLLVLYWRRKYPMPKPYPLNVEKHLPLPWLAQTSTVFSLTALFGAYFGIAVTLGLPALAGLACGTVLGLFLIRYWIENTLKGIKKRDKGFEDFLGAILKGDRLDVTAYALAISIIQCIYATSELLILREIAKVALGLKSEQATLLAVCVAIVGYFYVLLGGYVALFRTDVGQLLLVGMMALVSSIVLLVRHSQIGWSTAKLWPRPGFWEIPFVGPTRWCYLYHFVIATTMALGFLLTSPDTWKRVFQVNKDQLKQKNYTPRRRALTFVGVGVLPYLILLPFAVTVGTKADPQIKHDFSLPPALANNWVFVAVALGLVSSFLSSFNSALLASVHMTLIWRRKFLRGRKSEDKEPELARFYQMLMISFVVVCLVFVTALAILCNPGRNGFNNPWLLGNLLMGGYAAIGGVQIGAGGDVSRIPKYGLQAVLVVAMVVWVRYFLSSPGFSQQPTVFSVNTVPIGVALCVGIAVSIRLIILILGERKT